MEVEATEEVSNEPMDLMGAVQMVLKKALAEDGLHRGLREACKVRIRRSTVPHRPVSGVAGRNGKGTVRGSVARDAGLAQQPHQAERLRGRCAGHGPDRVSHVWQWVSGSRWVAHERCSLPPQWREQLECTAEQNGHFRKCGRSFDGRVLRAPGFELPRFLELSGFRLPRFFRLLEFQPQELRIRK